MSSSSKTRRPRSATPLLRKRARGELDSSEKARLSLSTKVFKTGWLELDAFKHWLRPVEGDQSKAYCTLCHSVLAAGKSELDKHKDGKKHKKWESAIEGSQPLPKVMPQQDPQQLEQEKLNKDTKTAEIMLSSFFAEHNIAIRNSNHLTHLLKAAFPDSKIVQAMSLDRTKCTAIIQNVLAKTEKDEMISILKEVKFSILVDESTDVSNKKNMAVLVKFVNPNSGKIETPLLEIIQLDATDTKAKALWESFTERLEKRGVPIKNIIGLACDHASVMFGEHNSFSSRLKEACPWVLILDCICHSSHLASSAACKKLPELATKTIRRLATYVSGSPKRSAILEEFQEFYNTEKLKILRPSATRWLVMHPCVVRILKNLTPLVQYLQLVVAEDARDTEARELLRDLRNPFFKAYLMFLDYSLQTFNEMNALFQHESPLIHKLQTESQALVRKICQNYMKDEYLTKIENVDVTNPRFQVPLDSIYLGPGVKEILVAIPLPDDPTGKMTGNQLEAQRTTDVNNFRLRCLEFYITGAVQLKKYLPMKSEVLREAAFVEPDAAISAITRQDLPELSSLAHQFGGVLQLDCLQLAREWRNLPYDIPAHKRDIYSSMTISEFWREMGVLKNLREELIFPNLTKLASAVLAFPHSNAEAERVFSDLTDVKNKKRNRMGEVTLDSLLVMRTAMRQKGKTCATYKIDHRHLERHNQNMYPFKEKGTPEQTEAILID